MTHSGPDLAVQLRQLKAQPIDHALDALEPNVWQRVAACTARMPVVMLPWRAAAVGLSLSLGATFGGAAAGPSEPDEMAVFSAHAALAPSTILEGYP